MKDATGSKTFKNFLKILVWKVMYFCISFTFLTWVKIAMYKLVKALIGKLHARKKPNLFGCKPVTLHTHANAHGWGLDFSYDHTIDFSQHYIVNGVIL